MSEEASRSFLIGAGPGCDIVLDRPKVSGKHARLSQVGRAYVLEDVGSTNGTSVDGVKLTGPCAVRATSRIAFGSYETNLDELLGAKARGADSPRPRDAQPHDQGDTWVIGAADECEIRVALANISGRHARLTRVAGVYELEDLGSTNGTRVDGEEIKKARVDHSSGIALGSHRTSLGELLALASPGRAAAEDRHARVVKVGPRMLTLGSDTACDIRIDDKTVSSRHAHVFRNCDRLIIEDGGSVNGTFVNGTNTSSAILQETDTVRIGGSSFRFEREPTVEGRVEGARLDVRDVSVDVFDQQEGKTKTIIHSVSFTAFPGKIVAVMGPAGSGKTTLVWAIAGVSSPTRGEVLMDRKPLHSAAGTIRDELAPLVGFAPQDDIVHALLTVEEAVRYAGRLRSPADTTDAQLSARVTKAIADVGLAAKSNTRIGSATSKSLSGGQRKRVSIAMELVTDPPVLLLDEPTSGLSSHDAAELMLLLRELADRGRTIFLTIHQPSYPMFVQMDEVVILDAGRLVYFGPTALAAFEFFDVRERQPNALFERLAETKEKEDWPARYKKSGPYRAFVESRARSLDGFDPPPRPPARRRSQLAMVWVLVARGLVMKRRDKFFWVVAVIVPLVASALISIVIRTQVDAKAEWSPTQASVEHTYLLVLTIMVCFFGSLSSSLEILYERAMLARERRSGLGVVPYVGSKAVLYAIPAVLHPAMSLAVFMGLGNAMEGSFASYYVVLVPSFFATASAGLCLSAAMGSAEGVVGLAVAFSIVQTVFSAFVPLHLSVGKEPKHAWLDRVSRPITARWTLGGLVTRSDICVKGDKEEEPSTKKLSDHADDVITADDPTKVVLQKTADAQFVDRCKTQFYEDHGVYPADSGSSRLSARYRNEAVGANVILSAMALIATGLILKRKRG